MGPMIPLLLPIPCLIKHLTCSARSGISPPLVHHYPDTRGAYKILEPAGCLPESWLGFSATGAGPSTVPRRTLVTGRCRFAASLDAPPSNIPSRDVHHVQAWRYQSTGPQIPPQPVPMMVLSRTGVYPPVGRSNVAVTHILTITRPGRSDLKSQIGEYLFPWYSRGCNPIA